MFNATIDRDAIFFHHMQMARAQSGSNASLTSIQSDPMYASVREVFHPAPQTSSRSIEVLVNTPSLHRRTLGSDDGEDVDSRHLDFEDEDYSEGDLTDSTCTLVNEEAAESFDVTIEALHVDNAGEGRRWRSGYDVTDASQVEATVTKLPRHAHLASVRSGDIQELTPTGDTCNNDFPPGYPLSGGLSTSNSSLRPTTPQLFALPPPPPPLPPPPQFVDPDQAPLSSSHRSIIITYL